MNINNLLVSSSGIEASKNFNGPIASHTAWLSDKYNLGPYMSETWRESNKKEIEDQDLVIFMEPLHYNYCTEHLHCNIPRYKIWNIPDVAGNSPNSEAENVFMMIRERVEGLI